MDSHRCLLRQKWWCLYSTILKHLLLLVLSPWNSGQDVLCSQCSEDVEKQASCHLGCGLQWLNFQTQGVAIQERVQCFLGRLHPFSICQAESVAGGHQMRWEGPWSVMVHQPWCQQSATDQWSLCQAASSAPKTTNIWKKKHFINEIF